MEIIYIVSTQWMLFGLTCTLYSNHTELLNVLKHIPLSLSNIPQLSSFLQLDETPSPTPFPSRNSIFNVHLKCFCLHAAFACSHQMNPLSPSFNSTLPRLPSTALILDLCQDTIDATAQLSWKLLEGKNCVFLTVIIAITFWHHLFSLGTT